MNEREFTAAVQAAFDARRDPLDEPAIAEHLLAHPEALPAVAAQRALLRELGPLGECGPLGEVGDIAAGALADAAPATRPRRRWRALAAVLPAAFALGFVLAPPHAVGGPRILEATLAEQRPPAGAAFHWRLRQVLIDSPTTRLELVEQASHRR